ncbi:MAG: sugar-transfer associated ATP-grasp domain-containing protein, partial [Gammaproteobacteria bacterium]
MTTVWDQLALAGRHAVSPPWYYMFELYEDARRPRAMEYLYRFETKAALYDILRVRLSDPVATNALSDKAAFAERCREHGLAVVPALATVNADGVRRLDGGETGLPQCDLFLKPLRGAGGRGASSWIYGEDGLYHGNRGTVLSEAGLTEFLIELSRNNEYVIRARVSNHPDLAALAGTALSTVRVVTCLDEEGRPEVTHAVLRMASSTDVVVDNFHAGGIAAAVELTTGRLGPATDMGLRADSRWWDTHPVSGAPITGHTIPMWEQVPELARRAHEIFGDQVAIGWDIAVCEEGPVLVEGNKSPDLDIIQRIGREPLGN